MVRSQNSLILKKMPNTVNFLTPKVFIGHHADVSDLLTWHSSHFFADDLMPILIVEIRAKYIEQCTHLGKND